MMIGKKKKSVISQPYFICFLRNDLRKELDSSFLMTFSQNLITFGFFNTLRPLGVRVSGTTFLN